MSARQPLQLGLTGGAPHAVGRLPHQRHVFYKGLKPLYSSGRLIGSCGFRFHIVRGRHIVALAHTEIDVATRAKPSWSSLSVHEKNVARISSR